MQRLLQKIEGSTLNEREARTERSSKDKYRQRTTGTEKTERRKSKVRLAEKETPVRGSPAQRSDQHRDWSQYRRFQYQPLQAPNEIRLVKLSPGSSEGSISIIHKSLDEECLYSAVSYMWGSQEPGQTTKIIVDTYHVLRVTRSLKLMLEDLRDTRQTRYLWIDAICINQNDPHERSTQVLLMGNIYSNANYVVAYLKDADYDGALGDFAYDEELAAAAFKLHQRASSGAERDYRYSDYDDNGNRKVSYEKLLNHPYFYRRWIIQEICLARSVTVQCSGSQFPLGELARASRSSTSRYHSDDRYYSGESDDTSTRAGIICQLRNTMDSSKSTLADLLIAHETAECSDFRDKVYALLSLTGKAKTSLPIDYSMNALDLALSVLYVSLTEERLSKSRLLNFACFLVRSLDISDDELRRGMARRVFGIIPEGTKLTPRIMVRGIVTSLRVDPSAEAILHKHRARLPSILQRNPIDLIEVDGFTTEKNPGEGSKLVPERVKSGEGQKVGQLDQWPFSFKQEDRKEREKSTDTVVIEEAAPFHCNNRACYNYKGVPAYETGPPQQYAGVSSVATKINDEIWQFPGTPVAFIARKTNSGYVLIGRALIFEVKDRLYYGQTQLGGGDRRSVELTVPELLELTMWANLDSGVDTQIQHYLSILGGTKVKNSTYV